MVECFDVCSMSPSGPKVGGRGCKLEITDVDRAHHEDIHRARARYIVGHSMCNFGRLHEPQDPALQSGNRLKTSLNSFHEFGMLLKYQYNRS